MIEIPCLFSAIKDSYNSKFHSIQRDKPSSYATLVPLYLWILHHIPYRGNFSPRTNIHGDHESSRRILYFSVIRNFINYTISNSFWVSYNKETRIIFAFVFQFYIILCLFACLYLTYYNRTSPAKPRDWHGAACDSLHPSLTKETPHRGDSCLVSMLLFY